MFPITQGTTRKLPIKLFDSNGDPKTGVVAPTITLSKEGAALAAPSDGTWTELAGGHYTIDVDGTDTNTLGTLVGRVTGTGFEDQSVLAYVEPTPLTGPSIAAAVWQYIISTAGGSTLSAEKIARLLDAAQGGKVSGVGTGTVTIRNSEDTKDVIVATVDGSGNRLSIALDLS